MKFLFTDSHTGKASSSKIWTHVAYGVATYVVLTTTHDANSWQMLLVYMAVVGGSEIAKKILTMNHSIREERSRKDD